MKQFPMSFFDYPVYTAALTSERRIINTDHIEQVKPHANVPVDPGAEGTACVEVVMFSGESAIVLLDYDTVKVGMNATFGVVDQNGNIA